MGASASAPAPAPPEGLTDPCHSPRSGTTADPTSTCPAAVAGASGTSWWSVAPHWLTTAGLSAARGKVRPRHPEARHVGAGTTGGTAKALLGHPPLADRAAPPGPGAAQVRRRERRGRVDRPASAPSTAWTTSAARRHPCPRREGRPVGPLQPTRSTARGEEATWVDEVPLPSPPAGAVRLDDRSRLDPVELVDARWPRTPVHHDVVIAEGARVERVHGPPATGSSRRPATRTPTTVVIATSMPILDRGGFARPSRPVPAASRSGSAEPAVDRDVPLGRPAVPVPARRAGRRRTAAPVGGEGHKVRASTSGAASTSTGSAPGPPSTPGASETHAWSARTTCPTTALRAGPSSRARGHLESRAAAKWGLTNGVAAPRSTPRGGSSAATCGRRRTRRGVTREPPAGHATVSSGSTAGVAAETD